MEEPLASPAKVVQRLLVLNAFGVMPGIREIDPNRTLLVDPAQIFTSTAPDEANYIIFLKDIAGEFFGRDQRTGHRQQHPGVAITVRHPNEDGYTLTTAIEEFFGDVKNVSVTIGRYSYNIQNVRQPRQLVFLGEEPERARLRWVIEVYVVFQYPPRTRIEE